MRTNKFGLLTVTTLVLSCTGIAAMAQDAGAGAGQPPAVAGRGQGRGQGGQRGGQFGRPIQLSDLSIATMDYGLKLSAEQKTTIQGILDQRATAMKALPAAPTFTPGQPPSAEDQQAMRDSFQKRNEISTKANTDIQVALTDEQKAKLPDFTKELQSMQQAGIPVAILGDLKLTEDQKKKIVAQGDTYNQARQAKMAEARQSGQRPDMQSMQTMQKDNMDKIMAMLTPTQHTMIDKYNKEHPQPAFGGFGGGRRQNGPGAGQGNGGAAGGN